MDKDAFWQTYTQELESSAVKDWGTGQGMDWNGFPKDPAVHIGASGPRMEREDIPSRVLVHVARMKDAMDRYAPTFTANRALKAAAKKHGFTSATALRTALLA